MTKRTDKVASLIQHIVAAELTRLPNAAYLTITQVEVSPDLRYAKAYVGILAGSGDEAANLFASVQNARDNVQHALASQLKTKFTPKLAFARDTSGEYAEGISKLIRGL